MFFADVTTQVPLVAIRGRALLTLERFVAQMELDMRIQQTLLRKSDRTEMAFEGPILGMNGKVSFEQAFSSKPAAAIFALELIFRVVQPNMSVIRSFDREAGVTLGTFIWLFSSVRVFVVTKECFLFERFTAKSTDEFLALEHPVLMDFHGLTRFEAPITHFTFKLEVAFIRLLLLKMNIVRVRLKLLMRLKLLLAGAAYMGFLAQLFHPLDYHLFLVI